VLYDSFSLRRLRLNVLLFPSMDERFPEGLLSALYAALNTNDTFDDCALRQRLGAIFEGERMTYEIDANRIKLRFRDFGSIQESKEHVHHLLKVTKETLGRAGMRFLYLPDEVYMWGLVPPGEKEDGGGLRTKATKLQPAHLGNLPGDVIGVGVTVHGHADEAGYVYDITVAPYGHGTEVGRDVSLETELSFNFPTSPPEDDVDAVVEALQTTYDFATNEVIQFAQSFMP
jgi:hypothetical protein